jgi:5-aminopentanamidase
MKIALAQLKPLLGDVDRTLSEVRRLAEASARQGADLLLLPELILPGYNMPEQHHAFAQVLDGAWAASLAQIAREAGLAICYGWAERLGDEIFNAASVLDASGARIAHYRKLQLYGEMERSVFTAGDALPPVFSLAGRRCGMLICYDIEFPEHARELSQRGAEVILVPTANPVGFNNVPNLLVPARAFENRVTVAYANFAGPDHGLIFAGQSVIAGPDGRPIVSAGGEEELLIAALPELAEYPREDLSTQREDLRLFK